jgi:transmembrane sensor
MTTKEKDEQTAAMHQAIQWSHRLDTEEDIETNWSEFVLWLEQSPQRQQAYHRVQRGRCETELYRETVEAEGIDEEALVSELNPALPSAVVKVLWASVPATLILGVAAVAVRACTEEVPWTPYHAAVGEVRALRLEDGTLVQLDIASALRARFSLLHRDVVLDRGQALFTPQHQWWRPFDVRVNQHVVRATGTKFIVEKTNDQESDSLVAEGQVKVLNRTGSNPGERIQEVRAGQVALIGPHGTEVHTASDSEVERRMAWIEGTLDFDETLQRAVEEFNRYNERKLFIDDPTLDALPVTGRFDAHNPDLFAEDLQKSHHIDHTSIGSPGSKAGEIHLKTGRSVSASLSRMPNSAP